MGKVGYTHNDWDFMEYVFFSVYATRIKRAMDKCDINADLAMKIGHQRGH